MSFEDYITGGRGGIPWAQAASFFVELQRTTDPQPVLTKEARAGLLKLAHIRKVAQNPEEAIGMTQQAAMTDPNVVAALDYQEMAAEREALQQTVQQLQQQATQAAQAQQAAEQQVQQMAANTEALQGQLEQANAGRQMAVEQAVQAKDEALGEVVNQQQHRAQIMQAADQLAMQLKQVAATSPNEAMAQQQQMAAEQEAAAAQQGEGGGEGQAAAPQSAKAKKETQEAQQAGVNAQVQGEQAAQAQQEDAAKQEAAAALQQQQMGAAEQAQQQQMGAAGAPIPKQGSALDVGGFVRALKQNPTKEETDAAVSLARKEGKKLRTYDDMTSYVNRIRKQGSDTVAEAARRILEKRAAMRKCSACGKMVKHAAIEKCSCGAMLKTAAPLGVAGRLAYAGGGGAIGAGHAAYGQYKHQKKHGKGKATDREVDRRADVLAASVKAKRDPTYLNKLRLSAAKFRADVEKADREHPGGAIARGAVKGALIGGLGGGAVHSLGGRVKDLVKSRAAAKAAGTVAKAAK